MTSPPAFDLDRALDVLATAVARPAAPDRLVLARHADFWRDVPDATLDPLDAVLPFGALSADGRRLVGLWVEVAFAVPAVKTIAAARAAAPLAVFVAPATAIARRLPPAVMVDVELRREECLRRWAAALDAPVARGGEVEQAKRSARVLDRLDYARIRTQEQRLDEERLVAESRRKALERIAAGGPL